MLFSRRGDFDIPDGMYRLSDRESEAQAVGCDYRDGKDDGGEQ